ncbi:MAG TPA: hypothetical protein VGG72_03415 [Bryobacteraceae bacterium]|jgi:hypothetical protein
MADQAERVILEAEDQVSPVVDKANAGLDRFEKQAESSHGKVIRISDQTRTSVQRLIASLEKQAETYGKSGVERLITQRDQLLQRYNREPQAIDAITKSYEKMIAMEEKAARESLALKAAKEAEEALQKQSEAIKGFGERVSQFMENPLQGARGAVSSVLTALGPFGVAVATGAAVLGTIAVSAFEAAKSLGEYGTRVKDAELRTGLTAKEVGQFGFAARAVGQDISIVERLMRGMAQAANDNSNEGEKARATMRAMGIEFHTATGEMKPTSEILIELSGGLNRLPAGFERDAAAMALFKKVGVEAIPFMTELNENLRVAHEQGFGPTEEDIHRFSEYQREVTVLETKWDSLVRKFKEGLVISVTWVGKGVDWFLDNISTARDEEREHREEIQALQDAAQIKALGGYGASMSVSAHRKEAADMERQAPDIMKNRDATLKRIEDLRAEQERLTGGFGLLQAIAPTRDEEDRSKKASDIQDQIQQLQKMLADAEAATKRSDLHAGKEETDRIRARFFGTHDGMEKAYADAKKDVERLQKELLEPDKPLTKAEAVDLDKQLKAAEANEARRKASLDAVAKNAEQLKEFQRQAADFEKKGDESELDAIGKIYYQRDQLLKQAAQVKASETEIAAIRKSAEDQASVLYKKSWEEFEKYAEKEDAERRKNALAMMLPSKEQMKEWEEYFAAQEKIEDVGVQAQREAASRRAARSGRMAELTAGQETPMAMSESEKQELSDRKEVEAAQQAYQARLDLAVQLAGIEAERISKEENAAKRSVLAAQAQKDLFTELAQAQDQFEEKQSQIQQKRQQEIQSQIDGLQKQAERLFDVLFTKPKNFGKDLFSTIHAAVLKPVTETLGGAVANVVHPIIYGSDGRSGLSGMLRGTSQDPVRVSTDMNTSATMQNSAVMASLTAILAASMGVAAPSMSGGTAGVPSISIPSISAPASASASLSLPTIFGGGLSLGGPSTGGGATSVSASGTPDLRDLPLHSTSGSAGFNPLSLLFPSSSKGMGGLAGSIFKPGGLTGMLGNLKNSVYNSGGIIMGPGVGTTAAGIGGPLGTVAGVASSPAAGMAGLMLGMNGVQRQGVGGTVEAGLGGALAGFSLGSQIGSLGGPMGAAIGAGAGVLAGVISSVFFESPQKKAHDDIRSIYGVNIPQNSGTIKQVVQIAQSQFGGDVAVAVRSPSVRQLVMLYSEATGQKMPLSATTPYAGSLVEQGGNVYQQASYQDGQAHTYASNIPTLGGIASGTYPTPGGPNTSGGTGATYLSMNVSGSDAANFMTGQFVTPQFVTDQAMAAQYSSYGRTQQSANMQLPGLTVS